MLAGDVPHQEEIINITKGEHKSERILALNPMGQVPFITVKGVPLYESSAIARYLANTIPKLQKYYPDESPEQRAHVDIGLDFCNTGLRPTSSASFAPIILAKFSGR